MAERRSLLEGMKDAPAIDPVIEEGFVFGEARTHSPQPKTAFRPGKPALAVEPPATSSVTAIPVRVALTTRVRSEISAAIKRLCLERRLAGLEPNSLQDIVEEALDVWLKGQELAEPMSKAVR